MTGLELLFVLNTVELSLPDGLLSSVCYVESTHRNVVNTHDGHSPSLGVCQVKLATARQMGFKGTEKQLLLPVYNIHYAGLYLRHQIQRYHGSLKRAVIAYNQGSTNKLTSTAYQRKVFEYWHGGDYEF
jgi:hypothetical protein